MWQQYRLSQALPPVSLSASLSWLLDPSRGRHHETRMTCQHPRRLPYVFMITFGVEQASGCIPAGLLDASFVLVSISTWRDWVAIQGPSPNLYITMK